MSSIPVRRTTRVVRSTKDNENANARPSRIATTRAKSALAGGTTATSAVATRATASTAASKAKAVAVDGSKEETGVKRKREVLVEVTGLATNNKLKDNALPPIAVGAKGKEVEKLKETVVKPKPVIKPPGKRLAASVAARRLVKPAAAESSATSNKVDAGATVASKLPTFHHAIEKMQVDDASAAKVTAEEDDDVQRVFKKRHTDEKPVVHAKVLDDSQAEADRVAAELEAVEPSRLEQWDDIDADDFDDPVMVSEYVGDVCVYLKEIELATMPNPGYMNEQNEITWEHRGILIDWLLQVHARFNLLGESLFLCVNVLDRFLSLRPISISKLQLVGLASFFIATKFEETYAPSVREIEHLADNQYTVDEILKAERYLLRIIGWDLRAPGPMGWLRRGSKADDCEIHARTVAKYLLEVGLVERRLIGVVPSLMAAAALWFGRLTLGREHWTPTLEHYTTYSEKEILPVANIMLEYIITDPVQHESLFKKYSHKRYFRCSTYVRAWALDRWTENGTVNLAKDLPELKEEIRKLRSLEEGKHV